MWTARGIHDGRAWRGVEHVPVHPANPARRTVTEHAGKLYSKEWPPARTERSLTPTAWRSKELIEPELSPVTSYAVAPSSKVASARSKVVSISRSGSRLT